MDGGRRTAGCLKTNSGQGLRSHRLATSRANFDLASKGRLIAAGRSGGVQDEAWREAGRPRPLPRRGRAAALERELMEGIHQPTELDGRQAFRRTPPRQRRPTRTRPPYCLFGLNCIKIIFVCFIE